MQLLQAASVVAGRKSHNCSFSSIKNLVDLSMTWFSARFYFNGTAVKLKCNGSYCCSFSCCCCCCCRCRCCCCSCLLLLLLLPLSLLLLSLSLLLLLLLSLMMKNETKKTTATFSLVRRGRYFWTFRCGQVKNLRAWFFDGGSLFCDEWTNKHSIEKYIF